MLCILRCLVFIFKALVITSPALSSSYEKGRAAARNGDDQATLNEWVPLAEKGFPRSQLQLGLMYFNGVGVIKNAFTALKWNARSAEQGQADAQYNLGLIHYSGQGIPKDDKSAIKWFTLAAGQRYAKAMLPLGLIHEFPFSVTRNYKIAAKWQHLTVP